MTKAPYLRPIHPFPARMAPSIAWKALRNKKKELKVLDPMAGSGTTLVVARANGHKAIGFDTDPLAVLISRTWCENVNVAEIQEIAEQIIAVSQSTWRNIRLGDAYPKGADEETKAFVRFWFDETNRRQLSCLSGIISKIRDQKVGDFLWCAFSRLIITKKLGASLAMDISHSRPHRIYDVAPIRPIETFSEAIRKMANISFFKDSNCKLPGARIRKGDARKLPLKDWSVDVVITSPPYLNAIDYVRGHKMTLVWMGYQICDLRTLRSGNIGTEMARNSNPAEDFTAEVLADMGKVESLPTNRQRMLSTYVEDMNCALREVSRVLVPKGKSIFVVGDSTIKGTFVRNSRAIVRLAKRHGLALRSERRRPLPDNRRYLPPPSSKAAGAQLQTRMKEEVILTFSKD